MLIQFSVKNFKTFKEKATITLVASNYDKRSHEEENVISDGKFNLRLLKSAVIYGANASGKSKFMEALAFMKHFVISSSKESQKGDRIEVEPFRLSTETEEMPTEFEVLFLHKEEMYRYGFEVDNSCVVAEWLYHKPKTKEVELFYREYQEFETHPRNFTKGNMLVREELVRDNALLLSVAAQFNDATASNVIEWFDQLKIISGLMEEGYQGYTMGKTESPIDKAKILNLLKAADLGIQDINLKRLDLEKLPKDLPKELKENILKSMRDESTEYVEDVNTFHRKYDAQRQSTEEMVRFSLEADESSGTRKFFALTGPILNVLENGYTLVVDELDSKLHANLVWKIVSLFNSKEINKKNAQLIFNTHNTNLLNADLLRRDQIWFAEKNRFGEAQLYSLAEFKSEANQTNGKKGNGVRSNEAFEDNYIRGKYGAVPFLEEFDGLTKKEVWHENEK